MKLSFIFNFINALGVKGLLVSGGTVACLAVGGSVAMTQLVPAESDSAPESQTGGSELVTENDGTSTQESKPSDKTPVKKDEVASAAKPKSTAAAPKATNAPTSGVTGGSTPSDGSTSNGGGSTGGPAGGGTNGSRCPAYPAFPDASCTGTLPGASLRSCSGNLTTPNITLDGCLFSTGVGLAHTAKNVTITNSKVLGSVYCATSNCFGMGLAMTDVEVDGQNSDDGVGGVFGYSCIRCEIHNAMKLIAGGNFHVEDSYLYDVYGEYSCARYPGDCQSHNEAVLPFDGDNNTLLHNNISANWTQDSTGNGMSAAIALYTHSSFWGGINNVLIEKNRISNTASPYCMYLGNTSDSDGNPSNLRLIDNVFGSCNVFLGWLRGNGNVWSNNRTSGGTAIAEPATGEYN